MTEKIVRSYSPEHVAMWMTDKARSAYEAYAEHADWTTYNGRAMPRWSDLGDDVRGHWEWTAMHIHAMVVKAEDVSRETSAATNYERLRQDVSRETSMEGE